MKTPTAAIALLFCLTLVNSGCSVFGTKPKNASDTSWLISKMWRKDYQQPSSLSVIWSQDVLTLTGKPPTRGFGGRVFFYNERTQAVPVEGDLIVHGYRGDPMVGESEQVQADKTFRFTAEQLTGHFSPSELGASYSVWIPWDAADGFREEVTLIPTFKGLEGQIVQGAPAKLFLPGRSIESVSKNDPNSKLPDYGFEAQTVSYQQRSIPTNSIGSLPRMERQTEPTTIELPALGSLGRPRANSVASPVKGFTLGSAGGSQLPTVPATVPTSGAFLPGPNVAPSSAMPPSHSSMLPEANGLPAPIATTQPTGEQPKANSAALPFGNLRAGMTPTFPRYGEQSSAPFAHEPWHLQP